MFLGLITSVFGLFVHLSSLARAEYTYSVFEEGFTPEFWTKLGAVDGDTIIPIRIALNQRNLDRGYEFLLNVSDPASPHYGKFWTVEQVYDTFAPPEESFNAAREWLVTSGISSSAISRSEDRGWISFRIPAHEAESLFHSKYQYFRHDEGVISIASQGYSIPNCLKEIIDFVEPGAFPYTPMRSKLKKSVLTSADMSNKSSNCNKGIFKCKSSNLTCCNRLIHPGCIRALYNLPEPGSLEPVPVAGNALAIWEPGSTDSQKSLNLFFRKWAPFIPQNTFPKIKRYGTREKLFQIGETALDFDSAYPVIYPQNIESLVFDSFPEALFTNGKRQTPNVISASFYFGLEFGRHFSKDSYRLCHGFMKLGLLGTSVLQASGDYGAGRDSKHQKVFALEIPINCPYITTVGATEVPSTSTVFKSERAAIKKFQYIYSSGGGFSQLFDAPSYQKRALATYFSKHDPKIPYYNGTKEYKATGPYKYNRLGRGVPDIAANGFGIATVYAGQCQKEYGTSASAPIAAGIVNKIVEERLKAGKSRLGFLNPAFYANPSMFNDITQGFNTHGSRVAFHAVKGWDPVTGLGTCDYKKMLKYFMSLK